MTSRCLGFVIGVVVLGVSVASCGASTENSCVIGQSIGCVGNGGCAGNQVCKSDHTFDVCMCAGTDAGADVVQPPQDSGGDASNDTGIPDVGTDAGPAPNPSALSFATSYVEVPDNSKLDFSTTFTLEAWIYPNNAATANQVIIDKWGTASDAAYYLLLKSGKIGLSTNNGSAQSHVVGTTTLSNKVWHHVAGTFNAGTMTVYLDGNVESTQGGGLTPIDSPGNLDIGYEDGGLNIYDGLIDEVRLWNIARTAPQITASMAKRLVGNEAGLVLYLRFDDGSGQVATDSSSSGLNGRLGSSTSVDSSDPTWTSVAPTLSF